MLTAEHSTNLDLIFGCNSESCDEFNDQGCRALLLLLVNFFFAYHIPLKLFSNGLLISLVSSGRASR